MSPTTQKRTPLARSSGMDVRPPATRRLARVKPYKAAAPEDTVSDIRSRLAGLGMSFVEEAIHGEAGSFSYCLRLVDDVRCEPVFQTMGKGRTDSYAKASAYGEMIERIQNLAFYMMLMAGLGVWLSKKPDFEGYGLYLKLMLFSIPVPYLAGQLGWIVAEVGRQPWIVYGVLKTADGVSRSISTAQVAGSLAGFTLFYGSLGVLDVYLLTKFAKKGPDDDIGGFIKMEGRRG